MDSCTNFNFIIASLAFRIRLSVPAVGFKSNDSRYISPFRSNFASVSCTTRSDGEGVALKTSTSGPCDSVIKKAMRVATSKIIWIICVPKNSTSFTTDASMNLPSSPLYVFRVIHLWREHSQFISAWSPGSSGPPCSTRSLLPSWTSFSKSCMALPAMLPWYTWRSCKSKATCFDRTLVWVKLPLLGGVWREDPASGSSTCGTSQFRSSSNGSYTIGG
jgi:hypothetical protein